MCPQSCKRFIKSFVTGVEMLVQHIASQTKTPPHYFYLSGQFPSGESIKSAETGLVAKVLRKQRYFGEGWEEVVRLGFKVEDGISVEEGQPLISRFTVLESLRLGWKKPDQC